MQLIIAYALLRNLRKRHCKDTKNIGMAEKKQANSYESIMKDLKARKFAPVYHRKCASAGRKRLQSSDSFWSGHDSFASC